MDFHGNFVPGSDLPGGFLMVQPSYILRSISTTPVCTRPSADLSVTDEAACPSSSLALNCRTRIVVCSSKFVLDTGTASHMTSYLSSGNHFANLGAIPTAREDNIGRKIEEKEYCFKSLPSLSEDMFFSASAIMRAHAATRRRSTLGPIHQRR